MEWLSVFTASWRILFAPPRTSQLGSTLFRSSSSTSAQRSSLPSGAPQHSLFTVPPSGSLASSCTPAPPWRLRRCMFRNCSFSCKPCSRQAWTIICRPRRLLDTYRPHSNRPVMCSFATTLFGNPCSHPTMAHTQCLSAQHIISQWTSTTDLKLSTSNGWSQRLSPSDCEFHFLFKLSVSFFLFFASFHNFLCCVFSFFFLFFIVNFSPAKFTGGGAM